VVVVVHLGTAAQAVGQVQAVLAVAGKEQTAPAQVRTELQIQVAVVVEAIALLVETADPELSLFDTEFRTDPHYFHLMQMAELVAMPR
jgi:hypothetical protein